MIYLFRLVKRSVSSELLLCGAGVHSILLLPLVARCLDTIYGQFHSNLGHKCPTG